MFIGNYKALSIAEARKKIKALNAQVTLGYDGEKQKQKASALIEMEADKNRITVSELSGRYYSERIYWPKHLVDQEYFLVNCDEFVTNLLISYF